MCQGIFEGENTLLGSGDFLLGNGDDIFPTSRVVLLVGVIMHCCMLMI